MPIFLSSISTNGKDIKHTFCHCETTWIQFAKLQKHHTHNDDADVAGANDDEGDDDELQYSAPSFFPPKRGIWSQQRALRNLI
jgi:hypothetical protein